MYRLTAQVEEKLLSISASTIDRALKAKKRKLKRRLYCRTKTGTLLKHKIPVKTEHWDVNRPGFVEADLLSHSGGSSQGEFLHSLNITDIFSGWVETRAVTGKGQQGILEALESISQTRLSPLSFQKQFNINNNNKLKEYQLYYLTGRYLDIQRS